MKEEKLLKKLVENGDIGPAPNRSEYYTPHYEVIVGIGKDHTAKIILDEGAYFALMEEDFE
jgi:hypothetical protein